MKDVITYFLQSNIYIIVFLMCYHFAFRKSTNYKFNRFYLLISNALSLLLPLITIPSLIPITDFESYPIALKEILVSTSTFIDESNTHYGNSITIIDAIIFGYFVGVLFSFLKIVFNFYKLYQIKKSSIFNEIYYEIPQSFKAFSFMRSIYIGSEIKEHDREVILNHELVHVKQLHSLDILFSRLLELLFWFNPTVYFLKNYFLEQHEYEADAKCNYDKDTYIKILLQQKFQINELAISHQFNSNTHLKSRIMRLKNQENRRISKSAFLFTFILIGICFIGTQNLNSANVNDKVAVSATKEAIQNDTVFQMVEQMPVFPGGQDSLMKFIGKNTIYPSDAKAKKITGRVFVTFVIGKTGKVEDVEILKGTHPQLDQAALDVINKLPDFEKPGIHKGEAVRVRYNIPLNFSL